MNSNYLIHHGIKGQKWGVRRYQRKDGTLTPAGKKKYGYDVDTNTDSYTMPKGTTVYRVSTKKNENGTGPIYVSYTNVDRDMYKGPWSRNLAKNQSGTPNSKLYEQKYKTNVELKIPSHDEIKKVEQRLKKDPNIVAEVGKAWATEYMHTNNRQLKTMREIVENDNYTFQSGKDYCEKFLKAHGNLSITFSNRYKDTKDEASLYNFAASIGISDYNKAAVIRELSKRGYNAMTDEFGVGGGNSKETYVKEGVQPLIIFDSTSISQTGSSKISNNDIKKSTNRYRSWYNEQNAGRRSI